MARKYSRKIIKKRTKRNFRKTKNMRRIKRRRKTRGGGSCPLHPAPITGAQSYNTMNRPVPHHGEMPDAINNPTYWSNYGQLGENVFGSLN